MCLSNKLGPQCDCSILKYFRSPSSRTLHSSSAVCVCLFVCVCVHSIIWPCERTVSKKVPCQYFPPPSPNSQIPGRRIWGRNEDPRLRARLVLFACQHTLFIKDLDWKSHHFKLKRWMCVVFSRARLSQQTALKILIDNPNDLTSQLITT